MSLLYHPTETPELTVRAIVSGMVIGALLTPCNVYSGLKIGWTFNMSVAAGLIGFAIWQAIARFANTAPISLRENNINQTSASAAASIISAGLAAPIPALALLTGQTLSFWVLSVWLLVISLLGIVVASGLRQQLLVRDRLPFPSGVVTAETMSEIHSGSAEAHIRLRILALAATVSAALKSLVAATGFGPVSPSVSTTLMTTNIAAAPLSVSAKNLGWALDPSFLMIGFGAISGLRVALSMLLGAVIGWGLLAPIALIRGWANSGADDPQSVWFGSLVEWLLWPGATLMVVASLTTFALSLIRLSRRPRASHQDLRAAVAGDATADTGFDTRALWVAFVVMLIAVVTAQFVIFNIGLVEGAIAVVLSYVLAIVAARVSGETAITPIGALGKITQLTFGAISPGNVSTNLMSANVTGGAAGQCADLMHDLKTGLLIGATPHLQIIAQVFGVLTGAFAASATYLLLIPDPVGQLLTPEWPAPAVATWKAVAEVLSQGMNAMPPGAVPAILIATVAGIALAVIEANAPPRLRTYVPSAPALGLGFCIPAWNSVSMVIGATAAALVLHFASPAWAKRVVVIAAGLIVGESLTGVGSALFAILFGA